MSNETCLFCKIVASEIPASIRYQDNDVIAFDDMHPSAPIHMLIAPKRHIPGIEAVESGDEQIIGKLTTTARRLIEENNLGDVYKLIINGPAIRHVDHLHFHLLSGPNLKGPLP